MARWTQYIGLSKEATNFLSNNKHLELCKYRMTTGICGEPVYGGIYEVHVETSDYFWKAETYAEVEDVTPWCSGPMIHTALKNISTGEVIFRWKEEDVHYN